MTRSPGEQPPGEDPSLSEARGEGADLFDAPSLFYLTYREHIERWHALREQAINSFNSWMDTLGDDLAALAAEAELQLYVGDTGGGWRHFLLHPVDVPKTDERVPAIATCLGWRRGKATPTGKTHAPFAGVRVARSRPDLREAFLGGEDGACRQLRDRHALNGDMEWPVWHHVHGDSEWWTDLDAYRQQLIDATSRSLDLFGSHVRRVVADVNG